MKIICCNKSTHDYAQKSLKEKVGLSSMLSISASIIWVAWFICDSNMEFSAHLVLGGIVALSLSYICCLIQKNLKMKKNQVDISQNRSHEDSPKSPPKEEIAIVVKHIPHLPPPMGWPKEWVYFKQKLVSVDDHFLKNPDHQELYSEYQKAFTAAAEWQQAKSWMDFAVFSFDFSVIEFLEKVYGPQIYMRREGSELTKLLENNSEILKPWRDKINTRRNLYELVLTKSNPH